MAAPTYDAVLVVSFGGPEGRDDVLPFLHRVTSGRRIPPERLNAVAAHYDRFGGVSPLNAETRALVGALESELAANGPALPVYWGNRNWHPLLADTLRRMADEGVRRALAFVTSAFGSYASCRQYLEDIESARAEVGAGAPEVDKVRLFFDHPRFVGAVAAGVATALERTDRAGVRVLFTAHSIPRSMAEVCPYERQLQEAAALVAARVARMPPWELVFQSRSGPPQQPWLEPDINDRLAELPADGVSGVVAVPLGFVADHMEVVYDLDVEARATAEAAGLTFARLPTPGAGLAPMVRDLVAERAGTRPMPARPSLGVDGPWPDRCPPGHCLPGSAAVR